MSPRAALLLVLCAAAPARAAAPATIAVLPFKNLNQDTATDWLKLGIAETMISDLRRAGHTVVERDQVDKALAELALQAGRLDDDARAARAGRLVGATTVVLGGFQKAGPQLRITARFVAVETGVVEKTAKATGAMEEVFALQDEIVAALVKLRPPPRLASGRAQPVRRPGTARTVEAYRAYAQAVATSSQAEKVERLQAALELDPSFHYAQDDLDKLRARLKVYEAQSAKALDEAGQKLLAELEDPALSALDRNMRVMQYLTGLQQRFRYQTLLEAAERFRAQKIPPAPNVSAHEYASYCVFLAAQMLKRTDYALQAGERHLQEFPGGLYAGSVQMSLRAMVDAAERSNDLRKKGGGELARIDREEAEARGGRSWGPERERTFAFQRCSAASQHQLWAEVDRYCAGYSDRYAKEPDPHSLLPLARWLLAMSLADRGDFARARAQGEALEKDAPEFARNHSLGMILSTWPKP